MRSGSTLYGMQQFESAGFGQSAVIGDSARHTRIIGTVVRLPTSYFATGGILRSFVHFCCSSGLAVDLSRPENTSHNIDGDHDSDDQEDPGHHVRPFRGGKEPDGYQEGQRENDDFTKDPEETPTCGGFFAGWILGRGGIFVR